MSDVSSHVEKYDQSSYWVAPARNFRSSARLHLQHSLTQNTVGYLLDPVIEKSLAASNETLKVADLACGNGIWLTELHSHFTKSKISAELDGFDINPTYFTGKAFLPESVSLRELDVFAKPPPTELIGIYDVVHIRAFNSLIHNSDLRPILTVASELLKPGGFIQWEENRGDRFTVESPSPEISKAACTTIVQVLQGGLQAKGIKHDWVDALGTELTNFGFQNTRMLPKDKRKQDYKGWTEDYLMVWEELAPLFPTQSEQSGPVSREMWVDLFSKGVKETEQGVVIHQGRIITAVGQKPQ
ncbi:hypothetical protein N7456_009495 [Penicillium angulare]|uniref:Methyltransferase domain-containing protein n=1 Tax=Penicillium angulare TaxID=116970 RepID=A0A9W9F4Z8_9EURO|nr:hypothetical protein N7456_009495 [Penicillium angulare]